MTQPESQPRADELHERDSSVEESSARRAIPHDGSKPRERAAVLFAIERVTLPVILVIVIVLFALLPATAGVFFSSTNVSNVLGGEAVVGIVALAVMIPIVADQYDISAGAVVGLAALLAAGLMTRNEVAVLPAVVIAILAGTAVGAINGFLVAYLKVSSLIATIGMSVVIQGLVALYSHDETIANGIPDSIINDFSGKWFNLPKAFIYFLIIALIVYVLLQHTAYGRNLHALGSNLRASRLIGLRTQWLTMSALMLSGTIAAVAGVLLVGYSGTASPTVGPGYTLPALSAVFLGSTTILPGRFNVPGTIISVYLVAIIINGLTLAGATDWVEPFFNGIALVIAVALASLVSGKAELPGFMRGRRRRQSASHADPAA